MSEQFSRTERLIGADALNKLKNAHVAVFGIGGVGSYVVEALARAGVGTLTLIDSDAVAESNINRQIIALHSTVGRDKVAVAAERVADINPRCRVFCHKKFVLPESMAEFDFDSFDYIVDAIDTVSAKLALVCIADEKKIPIICSMGTGNKLDPLLFEVTDIYKTSVCPLARVMRAELKKRGIKKLKVLYSKEEPIKVSFSEDNRRAVPASISFVPSAAGLIIAGEVIKDLMIATKKDIIEAHKFSSNHKEALQKDKKCGCFYCLKIFSPSEITDWIKDTSGTAMCPYCRIDSIIGESSGFPITKAFLQKMKDYWF